MMFSNVEIESSKRQNDAKQVLLLIRALEKEDSPLTIDFKSLKGVYFVILYGALEYTVVNCVQTCINIINEKQLDFKLLKSTLYALFFNNECNAIKDSGDKKWLKRYNLFSLFSSSFYRNIENTLLPCSTGNIKYDQLESIWKTFGIEKEVVPNNHFKSRLAELADNRNKIAHGRVSASDVGRNYSYERLLKIHDDLCYYCSYIIDVFRSYINEGKYLK